METNHAAMVSHEPMKAPKIPARAYPAKPPIKPQKIMEIKNLNRLSINANRCH